MHRGQNCWHARGQSHNDPPCHYVEEWPRPCRHHREPFHLGRLGNAQEKVITDLIGKDESIYSLWSEGQAFQGVLSLSTLAAYRESMRGNGAGNQGARMVTKGLGR